MTKTTANKQLHNTEERSND